jgi:DNA-binding GntR family transcriptional regulator
MKGAWSYYAIIDDITQQIVNGKLSPEDQLPTLKRMCASYDVARATLQTSLAVLRDRGLIVGRQGQGIYVAGKEAWRLDRCGH